MTTATEDLNRSIMLESSILDAGTFVRPTQEDSPEQVARKIAGSDKVTSRPGRPELLRRLRKNYRTLVAAHRELNVAAVNEAPSADTEWLLDNFYVIDEVFREVLNDLPHGYYKKLPTLANGPFAGLPCAYALAVGLLEHVDSQLDQNTLLSFVRAYQEIRPLTIGELWAVPTMLRIGLLEKLACLAKEFQIARAARALAREHSRRTSGKINLSHTGGDAYIAGLLHSLRDMHEVPAHLDEGVRSWLVAIGADPAEVLRREHQRQARNQVSIGNSVTSLRLLGAIDWASFFEELSAVEQVLRAEPTGVYVRQKFGTRDAYRGAVERLARGSGRDELDVARKAIALASFHPDDAQRGHLGYYLIGEGQRELARLVGYQPRLRDAFHKWLTSNPNIFYFSLLTALILLPLVGVHFLVGVTGWIVALAVTAAAFLPASEVAVAVLNFLVCRLLPPRRLPRMNFREGIPAEFSTFVVIPTLLTNPESTRGLLDRLELHYLANQDANLHFALLTDYADAPAEVMPTDEANLKVAMEKVRVLNERHAPGGPPRFYVLHRRRLYNPSEKCWMGWERKRGKLHEFNRLIRGATDTSYVRCSSDPANLPRTRFVLTLDSDTVLPRDSARTLVGTLAHPLNAPVVGKDGRVHSGYAILQPRVSFLYRTGFQSLFARLYAYSAGIDPYSAAVSDTYMDLFASGTFTGKGLYDIDAFEATAGLAFPENHILSHDLIESNFARCGLVSDVEVFDGFPARYTAYSRREHRWVRGDWQLLPWLAPRVPTAEDGMRLNPLPLLERWKVIDNLRRSLVPAGLLLMLGLGWTVLPGAAWLWTLFAVFVMATPLVLQLTGTVLSLPVVGIHQAWVNSRAGWISTLGQVVLTITFLAHSAWTLLDAVVRTLYRLFVSRHLLLEWETAAATEARLGSRFSVFLRSMWEGPALALLAACLVVWVVPQSLPAAAPFLAAWFISPVVAWAVSLPLPKRNDDLTLGERAELRRLACKTWRFFETYVGEEDHWLPPDNYQEGPVEAIAHRTSPTNMGLLLASTLSAHDLGYLSLSDMATRLGKTFDTFGRLERFRGHFLNWYDTRRLSSLPPAYVSSVDSGNMVGCLLVLSQGLREKLRTPIPTPAAVEGLRDRFALLRETMEDSDLITQLSEIQNQELAEPPSNLVEWKDRLARLHKTVEQWTQETGNKVEKEQAGDLLNAIRMHQEELDLLFPWLTQVEELTNEDLRKKLTSPISLCDLDTLVRSIQDNDSVPDWLVTATQHSVVKSLTKQLTSLADQARAISDEMDFTFLYNPQRHLFAIGYHIPRESLDQAHYDLLASEACLTSFLMVARGTASPRHWFQLGRVSIRAADRPGLMSWGGTMFEYLMPQLFLPVPEGTLLDVAWHTAIYRQIEYGRQTKTPWGISESAYNLTDAAGNYQYQAFGVPGLGLKRGLGLDLVVAPYACVMAVVSVPHVALSNLRRLVREGGEGRYGMYEAIDYTPDRLPKGQRLQVIRSYMAHHQGMSLLALTNALLGNLVQARLAREPMVRAVELLLQERVPLDAPVLESREPEQTNSPTAPGSAGVSRRLVTPTPREPRPHLLSNGRYSVMLTSGGCGYSVCDGLDVTRRRLDATTEGYGQFCYIRDLESGELWSAGHHPVQKRPDDFEAIYSIDKVEIRRRDGDLETLLEVAVSSEFDAEVRRITCINHGTNERLLELTSYGEVVLAPHESDLAHPAFHKLFVQTEWLPEQTALVCKRRSRAADQVPVWGVHVLAADSPMVGSVEWETDRARFIGRRGNLAYPAALALNQSLSGTTGPVLDPIFSLRCRVVIPGGGRVSVSFTTGMAASQEKAVQLATRFHSSSATDRVFDLAWAHSRVELKDFNMTIREAQLIQRLAGNIIFPSPVLRAPAEVLVANKQGQSALWRHGISGDVPIILVSVLASPDSMELLRRILAAHTYWRKKGLGTDLVILNEAPTSYHDDLNTEIMGLIRASEARDRVDRPGGVFVRKADQFSPNDLIVLQSWARVILRGDRGSLEDQVSLLAKPHRQPHLFHAVSEAGTASKRAPKYGPLKFFNGHGGFSEDGREYVIVPDAGAPPMPWVNVVSNAGFGFLITDSGAGYTWAMNSQLNRLTPWSNDPICDSPGEVIYLRDEETGEVWTPTPLPAGMSPTLVRHGTGYSVFQQNQGELEQELTLFVPQQDSVKLSLLRLTNRGHSARKISLTYYVEWVLGTNRELTGFHVVTSQDNGVVLATNPGNTVASDAVAFAAISPEPDSLTADRQEFIGRCRTLSAPAAMERVGLSGRTGAGLDPCAAMQTAIEIPSGKTVEIICLLGQAPNVADMQRLIAQYRSPENVIAALQSSQNRWDELLGKVQVHTPQPGLDLLLNRWLLYQTVSSRLWGRTGFYQSSGAFGFRDQLQDVMALVHAAPSLARQHILFAASRQFLEGDVQHWWHPPTGVGVRTRFSDDFLWLVFVACHYAEVTGDKAIFDESAGYLEAPLLDAHQEESYGLPRNSTETSTLYEHCLRSLEHGWKLGEHGLPLMGIGDWNDGMNKVGAGGKGETVWGAWFQIVCLDRLALVASARNDESRADLCRSRAAQLREAAEAAWDGAWYRRAYFDDGTPLGSSTNEECRIDSIAQSWSVLAGADPKRSREAMAEAIRQLVRRDGQLILLFNPPFDQGTLQPGYIKGYVPGTRENGGQYTHAATWLLQAVARLGERKQTGELLEMLLPVLHADTQEKLNTYKVEPYVVAADVYGLSPHVGRGGWTWYTGSAGWLYQVALTDVLGLRRVDNRLMFAPCVPNGWTPYTIEYIFGTGRYEIRVEGIGKVESVEVDGMRMENGSVTLRDDGATHRILVRLAE